MFQKELAQRIVAQPGGRDYGRLGVLLRYCAEVSSLVDVKATQFFPQPQIDSTVLDIRFRQHYDYPARDEAMLFRVVKAAFAQRRKTLKNSLAGSQLPIDAHQALAALRASDIDPGRRAETLTIREFVALSNCLSHMLGD